MSVAAAPKGTLTRLIGFVPGESYGGFVLGWFLVPFLVSMVVGLLIEYFLSAARCVDGHAFQTVTLASLGVGVFTGLMAFVVHKFMCKRPQ